MSKRKNKGGKYASAQPRKRTMGGMIAVILVLLAACMALLLYSAKQGDNDPKQTTPDASQMAALETVQQTMDVPEDSVNLGYGLFVTDIGPYTGLYMEDGSDEVLSNILMLVVKNSGDQDIQYAKIILDLGDTPAWFQITTLPAGETMVLLEQNRMEWNGETDYDAVLPMVENVAYFQEPVSLHEDKLKIQIIDGALNVTNLLEEDISGTIKVYYKNAAEDLLYGGITYQVTIEGGLKAGELRQVMTRHASDTGSRILFVTISQ